MASNVENIAEDIKGFQLMMQQMLDKMNGFEAWRSTTDQSLGTLLSRTTETATRITNLEQASPPPPPPPPPPSWVPVGMPPGFDLNRAPSTLQGAQPSASMADQPSGHGAGGGVLGPIPGTQPPPNIPQGTFPVFPLPFTDDSSRPFSHTSRAGSTPKMDFPKFDGTNPRLWREQCEVYFEIYGVSEFMKPRFATLNFVGSAAIWLQSVQLKNRFQTWEAMHTAVSAYFDKDQYPLHMKQLESLKQLGTVTEYQSKFQELAHSILLYNPSYDDVFFVTRFLGGLKEEIRGPLVLHRPQTLEEAGTLALLQEAELDMVKLKSQNKIDQRDMSRFHHKYSSAVDKTRGRKDESKQVETPSASSASDKLSALKAYRRANNLCFVCGEKYTGRNHKCPTQIPLHVIQELVDAVQDDHEVDYNSSEEDSEAPAGQIMAIKSANSAQTDSNGKRKNRTLRLTGFIEAKEVLILVDSGSAATFISQELATQISQDKQPCEPLRFTTADGSSMLSDTFIPKMQWHVQGNIFTQDTRILPLQCYDMVLGADWLEVHSPMMIHWRKKTLKFTYKGKRISLQGVKDEPTKCVQVSGRKLRGLIKKKAVTHLLQLQALCPLDLALDSPNHLMALAPTTDPLHDQSDQSVHSLPEVQKLIEQYQHLFQEPHGLPPKRPYDHHIPLIPGAQPVNVRPYRYAPQQKTEIERQVSEMLKSGIIQHSTSPYASPVLLVKKKDGSWRFCVDYRHLNVITVKNKHPLPIVDELLDELAGATYFSKLDCRSGYHQIRVLEGDEMKTAFKTHSGLYEVTVMPFGLTNAPATFQAAMNTIFQPLLRKCVLVFMDDILIYSKTLNEHTHHLQQVLQILNDNSFLLKRSKCIFAEQSLEYLGHIISKSGVSTEPSKITAVTNWPIPGTVKQLRGFLGLTGYYRRFIRHYGLISKPLTQLLKKGVTFLWTPQAQEAFQLLKSALSTAPVLAIPDFNKQFIIETDASDLGMGAVLMQEGHPISFLSKAFCPRNQALSTYEKECLALIMAVDKWRSYLHGKEFIIRTDHKSLLHLTEQTVTSRIQQKALLKLMDLQFRIQYKKGVNNTAADALSRNPQLDEIWSISVSTPAWLEKLQLGYVEDVESKQLLTELSISPKNDKGFSLEDGILRHKGKVWVGNNALAQQHILQALHASGLGGHSGMQATYQRVKALFSWPKLKETVNKYVQSCVICQQAKVEHTRLPGLLQPLPIPESAWSVVSWILLKDCQSLGNLIPYWW